ncbi:MAG: hypothetical protein M1305_06870, partial [Candidatus Marsarchaeota archaeon]|nr:hypothetical protein [Candidatus Marsarchaeota archaeon]
MPSHTQFDSSSKGRLPLVFAAKLRKPDLGAYLQRERLYLRLDESRASLVVVHADAGYGKTVLLASYLRERGRPAIWYHVGTTDRIPGTFTAHMFHELSLRLQSMPEGESRIEELLADPEMAGVAIASLVGHLDTPVSVVLEDYSRAEEHSEIHQIVLAMVEHLPPGAKVYLLSRHRPPLPMARLAMEGRAQVIAKEDLVFNQDETSALFTQTYDCRLSDQELALVVQRLEGWPAGLRLTQEALKATREPERRRFWANFSSSPALFDYLAEEVLVALPTPTLRFLYQTSIFSDLQPDLLEEFLPGSHPATILGHLARENLFTTSLSGAGTHYRYHNLLRQ